MPGLERLLADGEELVLDLRPHRRRLVLPVLRVPLICAVAGFVAGELPHGHLRTPLRWTDLGLALVLLGWFSLRPYLQWSCTRYVLTTRRLLLRDGVLARHRREIPLDRIDDVSVSRTAIDRMLRCGTVVVDSGGDRGEIAMPDVPSVERVTRTLADLMGRQPRRRRDRAGSW